MRNISKKMKAFYLILLSLLIVVPFIFFVINKKPSYELVKERSVENHSVTTNNNTYSGLLYEQDVLYSGKLTSDLAEEYTLNVKPPEDAITVNVKFFSSYDKEAKTQPDNYLKYEIQKIVTK